MLYYAPQIPLFSFLTLRCTGCGVADHTCVIVRLLGGQKRIHFSLGCDEHVFGEPAWYWSNVVDGIVGEAMVWLVRYAGVSYLPEISGL